MSYGNQTEREEEERAKQKLVVMSPTYSNACPPVRIGKRWQHVARYVIS